jgi:hypothetical protein
MKGQVLRNSPHLLTIPGKLKPREEKPPKEEQGLVKNPRKPGGPKGVTFAPPPNTLSDNPEDWKNPTPLGPYEEERREDFAPQDLIKELTSIPPEESGRDIILSFGDIWSKNPEAARAFCTPQTFESLNNVLEDAKSPSYTEEERKVINDKVYSMIRNLINQLPEDAERKEEIMKTLKPQNIIPILADKLDQIDTAREDPSENPILRMVKVQHAEETLDTISQIWDVTKDKTPFIKEEIPQKLLEILNELNRLGPAEAEKDGCNVTKMADIAQAIHPMLEDAAVQKVCINNGALPIIQESLEILEEVAKKHDPTKPIKPPITNVNRDIPFSPNPIECAMESLCVALKDVTDNKKVATAIPIEPEDEENTFRWQRQCSRTIQKTPSLYRNAVR